MYFEEGRKRNKGKETTVLTKIIQQRNERSEENADIQRRSNISGFFLFFFYSFCSIGNHLWDANTFCVAPVKHACLSGRF